MGHKISLIYGDGIGPEVVGATRQIIDATGIKIDWEVVEAGADVFRKGLATGVPQETIDSIARNKLALKGPLETPIGFGEKSANVTLRKLFETYGNIRPVKELPGVQTPYTGRGVDLVIVRENVEDLYAGIEHMQTPNLAQCLKIISRAGCERIIRLAFAFARSEGRKKVHCATKANIMKLTEGMMKRVFEEVAPEYPDIEASHIIVDNCAHMLVKMPENFDVIVTTNMNGDILSDLSSALVGGLGFAPGANIGKDVCIFEAVHGSAPKYAGKNNINPTAVLLSGVMMLRYLKEFEKAEIIEQALYYTMAVDKKLTRDVYGVKDPISTTDFTKAIIDNFGKTYEKFPHREYKALSLPDTPVKSQQSIQLKNHRVAGMDLFIDLNQDVETLGKKIEASCKNLPVNLKLISSLGIKIYPSIRHSANVAEQGRCRFFMKDESRSLEDADIMGIISALSQDITWTHIEKLHVYDGVKAFSKDHGEE